MARGLTFRIPGFRSTRVEELYYYEAKTRALISSAVTAQLVCAFVFTYADFQTLTMLDQTIMLSEKLTSYITLVNVYVALPVFTPVAGRSYAHFMEQNGGAQYVNSEFGRYFHFCWC